MKVMKLSVSILEADSLRILESIREVSFDRSPVVRYIMRFNKPICWFFHSCKHKPKEPRLKPKTDIASYYLLYLFNTVKYM